MVKIKALKHEKNQLQEKYIEIFSDKTTLEKLKITPGHQKRISSGLTAGFPGSYKEAEQFVQQLNEMKEKPQGKLREHINSVPSIQEKLTTNYTKLSDELNQRYEKRQNFYSELIKNNQKTKENDNVSFQEFSSFYKAGTNAISETARFCGNGKLASQIQHYASAGMSMMTGAAALAGNSFALNALGLASLSGPLAPFIAGVTVLTAGMSLFGRKKQRGGPNLSDILNGISEQIRGELHEVHEHIDFGINKISNELQQGFNKNFELSLKGFSTILVNMETGFNTIADKLDENDKKLNEIYQVQIKGIKILSKKIIELSKQLNTRFDTIEEQNIFISEQVEKLHKEMESNFKEMKLSVQLWIEELGKFAEYRFDHLDKQMETILESVKLLHKVMQLNISMTHSQLDDISNRLNGYHFINEQHWQHESFRKLNKSILSSVIEIGNDAVGKEFADAILGPCVSLFAENTGFHRKNTVDFYLNLVNFSNSKSLGDIFMQGCNQINQLSNLFNLNNSYLYDPIKWQKVAHNFYESYSESTGDLKLNEKQLLNIWQNIKKLKESGEDIRNFIFSLSSPKNILASLERYDQAFDFVQNELSRALVVMKEDEIKIYEQATTNKFKIKEALNSFDGAYKILFSHLTLVLSGSADINIGLANQLKCYLANDVLLPNATSILQQLAIINDSNNINMAVKLLKIILMKTQEFFRESILNPVMLTVCDQNFHKNNEIFISNEIEQLDMLLHALSLEMKNTTAILFEPYKKEFIILAKKDLEELRNNFQLKNEKNKKTKLKMKNVFGDASDFIPEYHLCSIKISSNDELNNKLSEIITKTNNEDTKEKNINVGDKFKFFRKSDGDDEFGVKNFINLNI